MLDEGQSKSDEREESYLCVGLLGPSKVIAQVGGPSAGPRNELSKARPPRADRGVRFRVRRRECPGGQQRRYAKLLGTALAVSVGVSHVLLNHPLRIEEGGVERDCEAHQLGPP